MTSGNFEHVSPEFIWVNREGRQRKTLVKIEELAKSIQDNGLIHPPVIRRDGELIVGERRWTAVKSLGWTSLPIQWVDELDEAELHAIEFEENISRVDLPWQEQVLAIESYNTLRKKQDPAWNASRTAEALGMKPNEVSRKLAVAKEMKKDKSIAEAPLYSTAHSMTERKQQRAQANSTAAIVATVAPDAKPLERKIPLLHADFIEWSRDYAGPKFNMIHCDFPYGVNMHETDQGTARIQFGSYADAPDVYWKLLEELGSAMTNVVDESAHLMFWFSMDYYEKTKLALEEMGWNVNPFPLVWLKSDNTGVLPDAKRGPRRIYETAFFGSRGDRFIVRPKSNATNAPGREKEIHMNEKPRGMLQHFLEMFVDEHTRFLDPTCGSANAVRVAQRLGASAVLGLERHEEFFNLAKGAYYEDL